MLPRALAALSLTAFLCAPRLLHATTAADICTGDPCVLSVTRNVTSGSTLDFGARLFRMTRSGLLRIPEGGTLLIKARSVEMQPGALIDQLTPIGARGATLTIETTTGIALQRGPGTRARINLSAPLGGAKIVIHAGGNVDVDGDLQARGLTTTADGGTATIQAGGNVNLRADVALNSGSSGLGGELEIDAVGSVLIGNSLPNPPVVTVAGGLLGGTIDIVAGRSLTILTALDASGGTPASDGGDIELVADGDLTISGAITVQGLGSELSGGFGGDVAIVAGGTLSLNGTLLAWGGAPDGEGGTIDLDAGVDLIQTAQIIADGRGTLGFGGGVDLHAGRLLSLRALINVHGTEVGGDVSAEAHAEVRAEAEIDAGGSEGGAISFSTTDTRNGQLVVAGPITLSGNIHADGELGGSVVAEGCNVGVPQGGKLNVNGVDAPGVNVLQGSGAITIAGTMLAQTDGVNELQYLGTVPQVLVGASVVPPADLTQMPALGPCRPPTTPVCGNGTTEVGEACDDGNTASCDPTHCSAQCKAEECGNGTKECEEACDDGNRADGDGCDSNCTATGCGNGIPTAGEACDDGNRQNGDGCDSACAQEPPPGCGSGPPAGPGEQCDDGNLTACDGCSPLCLIESCGNNRMECQEQCDDGNLTACDGCSGTCKVERCGNGPPKECTEECDDGNTVDGDGCDTNCKATACGNGIRTGNEQCDDGNVNDCDGCSPTCQIICGDGDTDVQCGEDCDAGAQNGRPGLGCSLTCKMCTGRPECPCAVDTDCGPGGQCGGFLCDDQGICQSLGAPLQCDDGNACNGTETCRDGACQPGAPMPCDDGNTCNGAETCVDNACVSGTAPTCADTDECTDDVCTAADGCVHATMAGVAGIGCQQRAMTTALARAENVQVTTKIRTKLQKLLGALQQKVSQASAAAGNDKKERKALKAIRKLLGKIDKALDKALAKHQIAPEVAGQLGVARDSASRNLEVLLTP